MKKLVIILALMIIPCSAFGMEMLNDNTMDGITGQSGVTIAFDDIQLFINIDTMAYIDCDGLQTITGANSNTAGGAVGINNFQIDVLNINGIVSSTTSETNLLNPTKQSGTNMKLYSVATGDIPLFYNYGSTASISSCYLGATLTAVGVDTAGGAQKGLQHYTTINSLTTAGGTQKFQAQGLTIDVTDALPAATGGWQNNWTGVSGGLATLTVGGVYITLPTCEIYINSMILTPFYTGYIGTQTSTAANDIVNAKHVGINSNYGTMELDGITLTVLSGWVEIAPH